MKKLIIILAILIANNLIAQDMQINNDGNNLQSAETSISKKDFKTNENNNGQKNSVESTNPRVTNPFGVNLNIGGPSILLSFSLDYFITSSLNIEAGVGLIGTFAGIKYHLNGHKVDKNWTPYLGLYAVRIPEITFFSTTPARNGLYIPLGIQYISNEGYTLGVEAAGITIKDIADGTNIWGAIKLGYHF